MNAHGIDIFDKADCDHIVVRVPDDLQFQFLPSQDGFFYQNLSHKTGLQSSCAYGFQFFLIVYQAAAGSAHCVGRTEYNRVSQLICDLQSFAYAVGNLAPCHFNTDGIHGFLELNPVFAPFNGVHLNSDNLHVIFVQNSFF